MPIINHIKNNFVSYLLLFASSLFICSSCSKSSDPEINNEPDSPKKFSLPLEGALTDVFVPANQTTQVKLTLQFPPRIGNIESAMIDVGSTLNNVTVSGLSSEAKVRWLLMTLTGQDNSQAFIRVSNDAETVCQQGAPHGPYPLSQIFLTAPDPDTITADEGTLLILNSGPIAICMELFSSFDVTFSVDQLDMEITEADCGTPTDFSGIWAGTYRCGNSCGGIEGDTVQITVTQNGNTASYTDLIGDTYTGTVCGNIFRFERIVSDEIERGSMILDDVNHATKRSTWRDRIAPFCNGDCLDILTRVDK